MGYGGIEDDTGTIFIRSMKYQLLKTKLGFNTDSHFTSWLLDVAETFYSMQETQKSRIKDEEILLIKKEQQAPLQQTTNLPFNVNSNLGLPLLNVPSFTQRLERNVTPPAPSSLLGGGSTLRDLINQSYTTTKKLDNPVNAEPKVEHMENVSNIDPGYQSCANDLSINGSKRVGRRKSKKPCQIISSVTAGAIPVPSGQLPDGNTYSNDVPTIEDDSDSYDSDSPLALVIRNENKRESNSPICVTNPNSVNSNEAPSPHLVDVQLPGIPSTSARAAAAFLLNNNNFMPPDNCMEDSQSVSSSDMFPADSEETPNDLSMNNRNEVGVLSAAFREESLLFEAEDEGGGECSLDSPYSNMVPSLRSADDVSQLSPGSSGSQQQLIPGSRPSRSKDSTPTSGSQQTRFPCRECGQTFPSNYKLLVHKQQHTGDWPRCPICQQPFRSKYSLTNHMRIHTGEKPFICKYCNKAFNVKSNMYKHIRINHAKEAPFNCTFCGKQMGDINLLRKHLKLIHKFVLDPTNDSLMGIAAPPPST